MNKNITQQNLFWIAVILFDLGLLIFGFLIKSWILSLLALTIILVVKRYGYNLLFRKYDDDWDYKRQEYLEKKRRHLKND